MMITYDTVLNWVRFLLKESMNIRPLIQVTQHCLLFHYPKPVNSATLFMNSASIIKSNQSWTIQLGS